MSRILQVDNGIDLVLETIMTSRVIWTVVQQENRYAE